MNIENRIYSVALNGKLGAEYMNGEHGLNMEVQMPAMKKMMLHMGLFNVYQAKKISNRLEVETQMPTGSLYQMSLSNAVNDLDRSLYTYTAITELSVKSNAAEDIKIRMDSKRAITGDKRNTDFKVSPTSLASKTRPLLSYYSQASRMKHYIMTTWHLFDRPS